MKSLGSAPSKKHDDSPVAVNQGTNRDPFTEDPISAYHPFVHIHLRVNASDVLLMINAPLPSIRSDTNIIARSCQQKTYWHKRAPYHLFIRSFCCFLYPSLLCLSQKLKAMHAKDSTRPPYSFGLKTVAYS